MCPSPEVTIGVMKIINFPLNTRMLIFCSLFDGNWVHVGCGMRFALLGHNFLPVSYRVTV